MDHAVRTGSDVSAELVPELMSFAGGDWEIHGRAHCDFQIMREFGKHRRVLVVNSIGMRLPRPGRTEHSFRRIARKAAVTLRYYLRRPMAEGSPGLYVMTPFSFPVFHTAHLASLNAGLVALQIALVLRLLRIRKPTTIIVTPTMLPIAERLELDKIVYYRSDDHSAADDVDSSMIRGLEDRLIARSQAVLYSSNSLMVAESDRSGTKAVLLDHGVDLDHFHTGSSHPEPADLEAIPHPRVGFFGAMDRQSFDVALVADAAASMPDVSFVLIGRVLTDVDRLRSLPNVHFLGFKPYDDVPAYGRGFDVAMCPFPDSRWIDSANPIKLKEYLALGLAVVSTPCPDVARFAGHVKFARTSEEFSAALAVALDGATDAEEQRAAVLDFGWDHQASVVLSALSGASGRHG